MATKTSQATITTIGIGKNSFHVIGFDERGAIVLRQKLSRSQVAVRFANLPRCLIGMEACVGAHHLGRRPQALGHDVRIMPALYVKPYLKGQKNDFRDAEAIAEAVHRPTMRFAPRRDDTCLRGRRTAPVRVGAAARRSARNDRRWIPQLAASAERTAKASGGQHRGGGVGAKLSGGLRSADRRRTAGERSVRARRGLPRRAARSGVCRGGDHRIGGASQWA